jgi:site-specific DNA recombinase
MKVFGYCRVSTDNQKDEGTIEIQRVALREYAEAKGLELVEIFSDDGVSGGLEDRPALAEMFNALEERIEIGGVLIFKLDRLARDLYIQEHLIKQLDKLGKKIISTKEQDLDSNDPMRKAFRQFMGIVSELEKSFITMRLSGGRINKAKKGKYAGGGVAMGYLAKGKELAIDPLQADTIRAIFEMKRKRKGYCAIARDLNERSIPTSRGKRWYAGTVKYILKNPLYRGVLSYRDIDSQRADLAILPTKN